MRILIATPMYPPTVGGPSKYAKALHEEFTATGKSAGIVAYGAVERLLPPILRHVYYFLRLLPRTWQADAVLALDTWSVGVPALFAALLFGKKFLVRVGGDVLWEQYVERTGDLVKYSQFYATRQGGLSRKERLMRWGHGRLAKRADALIFNSRYQRDIWQKTFRFPPERARIVENFYAPAAPRHPLPPSGKVFVSAGRSIKLKNTPRLHEAFARVKKDHPEIELDTKILPPQENAERLKRCYATIASTISDMNPNLIIEGVMEGKPFVAPLESGARERLGGLGVFVDTSSVDELERGIRELLTPETYRTFAEAISNFSFVHSWEDIAREYLAIAKEA